MALVTYKIQGQTAGDIAIVTKTVVRWPDGSIRYAPTEGGEPVRITDPNALRLLSDVLDVINPAYP